MLVLFDKHEILDFWLQSIYRWIYDRKEFFFWIVQIHINTTNMYLVGQIHS